MQICAQSCTSTSMLSRLNLLCARYAQCGWSHCYNTNSLSFTLKWRWEHFECIRHMKLWKKIYWLVRTSSIGHLPTIISSTNMIIIILIIRKIISQSFRHYECIPFLQGKHTSNYFKLFHGNNMLCSPRESLEEWIFNNEAWIRYVSVNSIFIGPL